MVAADRLLGDRALGVGQQLARGRAQLAQVVADRVDEHRDGVLGDLPTVGPQLQPDQVTPLAGLGDLGGVDPPGTEPDERGDERLALGAAGVQNHQADLGNGRSGVGQNRRRGVLAEVLTSPDDDDPLVAEQRRAQHLGQVTGLQRPAVELGELGLGVARPGRSDDGRDGPRDEQLLLADDEGQRGQDVGRGHAVHGPTADRVARPHRRVARPGVAPVAQVEAPGPGTRDREVHPGAVPGRGQRERVLRSGRGHAVAAAADAADPTTMADDRDVSVAVAAVGAGTVVLESPQRRRRRMAVRVAGPHRGQRDPGVHGVEEVRVLLAAAVVGDLQDIGVQADAALEQRLAARLSRGHRRTGPSRRG